MSKAVLALVLGLMSDVKLLKSKQIFIYLKLMAILVKNNNKIGCPPKENKDGSRWEKALIRQGKVVLEGFSEKVMGKLR